MTYDGENKRVRKSVAGSVTTYLYDIFGNLITVYNTSSDAEQNYIWANSEPRAKVVPIEDPAADLYYWFHTDHLGTPYVLTTSSKAVHWKISLDPFGETVVETNGDDNNLRFPGQYLDRESGLNYNWHRFYQPKIGRYYQVDLAGNTALAFNENLVLSNPYSYSENNAIKFTDRLGLWTNPSGGGIREEDCCGRGDYKAPREGNPLGHRGVDYVGKIDGPIVAPIGGTLEKDTRTSVRICGRVDGVVYCVRLQHITAIIEPGPIKEGQFVGTINDLRSKKCPTITPHVHLELYKKIDGMKNTDPTSYIPLPKGDKP